MQLSPSSHSLLTPFTRQSHPYPLPCGALRLTGDDARGSSGDGAILLVLDHAGDAAVRVVEVAVAVRGASGVTCGPRIDSTQRAGGVK